MVANDEKIPLTDGDRRGTDSTSSPSERGSDKLDKATSTKSSLGEISMRQILLIINFALVRFFENFCATLPSPFLARVVASKGGTVVDTTFISQIRLISTVIFSPIFGHYYRKIGPKTLTVLSLVVSAVTQCFFATLDFVNDVRLLTAVGVVLRFFYGIGNAALFVSVNTISCEEFTSLISTAYGIFLSASSLGNLIGPAVGGVLYDKFGMFFPVLSSGLILLLFVPAQWFLLRSNTDRKNSSKEPFQLLPVLRNPRFLTTLLLASTRYGSVGYFSVTLTLYMKQRYDATDAGIGLGLEGVGFAVFSVLTGYLAGRVKYWRRYSISIAGIFFSASIFLFTPNQSLTLIYAGCALLGVFGSAINISSFSEVIAISHDVSPDSGSDRSSKVTGLWVSFTSFFMFMIQAVASGIQVLTSATFTESFFGLSFLNLSCAVLQGFFAIFWKR